MSPSPEAIWHEENAKKEKNKHPELKKVPHKKPEQKKITKPEKLNYFDEPGQPEKYMPEKN